jgi:hypothetical protein
MREAPVRAARTSTARATLETTGAGRNRPTAREAAALHAGRPVPS